MLNLKIGKAQKIVITVNEEKIEIISERNVVLNILANKEKVSVVRIKTPIACEDITANLQEKELN